MLDYCVMAYITAGSNTEYQTNHVKYHMTKLMTLLTIKESCCYTRRCTWTYVHSLGYRHLILLQ